MGWTDIALETANAPWRDKLSRETFARIARGEEPMGKWAPHIAVLLNEVHPSVLRKMAVEDGIGASLLVGLFESLPESLRGEKAGSFFMSGLIEGGKDCWS